MVRLGRSKWCRSGTQAEARTLRSERAAQHALQPTASHAMMSTDAAEIWRHAARPRNGLGRQRVWFSGDGTSHDAGRKTLTRRNAGRRRLCTSWLSFEKDEG